MGQKNSGRCPSKGTCTHAPANHIVYRCLLLCILVLCFTFLRRFFTKKLLTLLGDPLHPSGISDCSVKQSISPFSLFCYIKTYCWASWFIMAANGAENTRGKQRIVSVFLLFPQVLWHRLLPVQIHLASSAQTRVRGVGEEVLCLQGQCFS